MAEPPRIPGESEKCYRLRTETPEELAARVIEELKKRPAPKQEPRDVFKDCVCAGSCKGPFYGSRCRLGIRPTLGEIDGR